MSKKIIKKRIKGIVNSSKMDKTVIVRVVRNVLHAKYHKTYAASKRYPADCGKFKLTTGDSVIIEECRPISKTKRWRVIEKITK